MEHHWGRQRWIRYFIWIPDSKYFWLCGLYSLCHNTQLCPCSQKAACKSMWPCANKILLTKQVVNWMLTPVLDASSRAGDLLRFIPGWNKTPRRIGKILDLTGKINGVTWTLKKYGCLGPLPRSRDLGGIGLGVWSSHWTFQRSTKFEKHGGRPIPGKCC